MSGRRRWMVGMLALIAFVAPLKFGAPVVLESLVPPPRDFFEWVFFSWPNQLGVLLVFGALGWMLADRARVGARVDLLLALPIGFLLTQAVALPGAINPATAVATTLHFASCVLLFYAAAWYVRDGAAVEKVFAGLGLATFLVCSFAMEQWWTGLEATRAMVEQLNAAQPGGVPPELLARLQSNRVFATLVYPNALAGFLVVVAVPVLGWLWVRGRNWDRRVKWATLALVAGVMVFCLALTGSRGGFVAFVAAALTAVWCGGGNARRGVWVGVVAALGAVFALAVAGGLIRLGGSSLGARFDYWQGAAAIIRDHPLRGTGPGTFGSIYPKYKQGETEEAQLAHNQYLQVWSDSGVVAFVVFAALWLVALRDGLRLARHRRGDVAALGICAALMGWAVHGLVDFDLHVPGVAFPVFILLGALQGLKEPSGREPQRGVAPGPWVGWAAAGLMVAAVCAVSGRSLAAAFYHGRAHANAQGAPYAVRVDLARAVALAPQNSHYLASLGDLDWRLGRADEAVTAYRRAVTQDPYRASYRWRLANLLGPTPQGLDELRRAVALHPTKVEYRAALEQFEESVRQEARGLLESRPVTPP